MIFLPDKITGSMPRDKKRQIKIKARERKFLSRHEILPVKGRRQAPTIGMQTALKSMGS
jgi:hypothetical protein